MQDFRARIIPHSAGTLTWSWADGNQSSIEYTVHWADGRLVLTLHYFLVDGQEVRLPIQLQTTAMQFGGSRYWFTCPLSLDGVDCNRRVGKLYLPPGATYFGCRKCHELTYQSCQLAHQTEQSMGCQNYRLKQLTHRLQALGTEYGFE